MRLDLFLKKTAVIKRRTIAKEIVGRGNAKINGRVAKPSSEVKDGDIIDLHLGNRNAQIKAIIEIKGSKENPSFEIVKDEKILWFSRLKD